MTAIGMTMSMLECLTLNEDIDNDIYFKFIMFISLLIVIMLYHFTNTNDITSLNHLKVETIVGSCAFKVKVNAF